MKDAFKGKNSSLRARRDEKKVLFVNVTHADYPRHKQLVNSFREKGFTVEVIHRPKGVGYFGRCLNLLVNTFQHKNYSIVVLAEFANSYAWVSWAVAKLSQSTHIVDGFIGMHETHVEDTRAFSPGSLKGIAYKCLDWFAFASADHYLIDTHARKNALLSKYGRLSESTVVSVLPVGAPDWASPQPMPLSDDIHILYYGNYIPLHGVENFIKSLALLNSTKPWHATFIGPKTRSTEYERLAQRLGLTKNIIFIDAVNEFRLIDYIREHHIVVGIFGNSSKAQSVIANKVWQGLAAGRVVLTRDTPGISEIASMFAKSLWVTDSDMPYDIAAVLDKLMTHNYDALSLNDSRELVDVYTKKHYDEFLNLLLAQVESAE